MHSLTFFGTLGGAGQSTIPAPIELPKVNRAKKAAKKAAAKKSPLQRKAAKSEGGRGMKKSSKK